MSRADEARTPDWRRHEAEVQERLGLAAPVGSGNKFYDISDGVDRGHPSETRFRLMVDCKATVRKSYSLRHDLLANWKLDAIKWGATFMLPLRFEAEDGSTDDWAIMHLDDMSTLLDIAREPREEEAGPARRPAEVDELIDNLTALTRRIGIDDREPVYDAIELLAKTFPEVTP